MINFDIISLNFRNRNDDLFLNYIDKAVDLNSVVYANGQRLQLRSPEVKPLKISQVIESCHRNNSIYKVRKFGPYDENNVINLNKLLF